MFSALGPGQLPLSDGRRPLGFSWPTCARATSSFPCRTEPPARRSRCPPGDRDSRLRGNDRFQGRHTQPLRRRWARGSAGKSPGRPDARKAPPPRPWAPGRLLAEGVGTDSPGIPRRIGKPFPIRAAERTTRRNDTSDCPTIGYRVEKRWQPGFGAHRNTRCQTCLPTRGSKDAGFGSPRDPSLLRPLGVATANWGVCRLRQHARRTVGTSSAGLW